MTNGKRHITKLDAAKRQLRTAIKLWFADGDAVSVHTLAYASYEIIHAVSRKQRKPEGKPLLYDTAMIKDEYRGEFAKFIKLTANFFKHAKTDPDPSESIEFDPALTEVFMYFAILGLSHIGVPLGNAEVAFQMWAVFRNPKIIADARLKEFVDRIPVEHLAELQSIPKSEFLQVFIAIRRQAAFAD